MTYPLTDTHCHLDLEQFEADRRQVLERARAAGLTRILVPALDLPSSRRVVELAGSDPMLFAALGFHPTQSGEWTPAARGSLAGLATQPGSKVRAIGEIGLDYYWDAASHKVQREVLQEQLDLAAEAGLPVVLHLREEKDSPTGPCAEDLLAILTAWVARLRDESNPLAERPGVLHSFSGDLATAQRAIGLGFYLGVTGPVTYKNAEARRELLRALPLERLLIETDAPYLAPVPERGRRNEPAFVAHIADKIATIHNTTPEEIAAITCNNAQRLFAW